MSGARTNGAKRIIANTSRHAVLAEHVAILALRIRVLVRIIMKVFFPYIDGEKLPS